MYGFALNLFHYLCHQSPDRSPAFGSEPFPVCFRCAGLYCGVIGSFLYLIVSGGLRRSFPAVRAASLALAAASAYEIDGLGNTFGWWQSPSWVRGASGIAAGVLVPLLAIPLIRSGGRPVLRAPALVLIPWGLGAGLLAAIAWPGSAGVFHALSAVPLLGFVLLWGTLGAMFFASISLVKAPAKPG